MIKGAGVSELSEQTWVLTGAAGRVASSMRSGLAAHVGALRLVDIVPVTCEHSGEQAVVADLRDQLAVETAVAGATLPPRPDGLYGVRKVAGEALGRLYADTFGLAVASVRIGSFEEAPQDARQLSTWLSPPTAWPRSWPR